MALRDLFKRKKKTPDKEKTEIKKERIKGVTKEKKEEKIGGKEKTSGKPKTKLNYNILKSPIITEKATDLREKNQYVFKVFEKANKTEIKKAVESLYDVNVLNVRIIKVPGKKRVLGKISGWRKGYKKAIVKIEEGQKIEELFQ